MAKREISGSRAIVTGASSGIGRALVVELARQGAKVVATARRQERLDALRSEVESAVGTVVTLTGDVTDAATRQKLLETAQEQFGGLDILVNNAGVGAMGRFEQADAERLRRVMEVNFFAPVELIRQSLPMLAEGKRPIIVNVSSILGLRATPYSSEYSASKFAIQGFSEALRTELIRQGIDVLVVCPGTTETEFFDSVLEKTEEPSWPEHKPISPEAVAAATVRAMRRGRHVIIPYGWGKIFCWLNRLSPRLMDAIMAKYA